MSIKSINNVNYAYLASRNSKSGVSTNVSNISFGSSYSESIHSALKKEPSGFKKLYTKVVDGLMEFIRGYKIEKRLHDDKNRLEIELVGEKIVKKTTSRRDTTIESVTHFTPDGKSIDTITDYDASERLILETFFKNDKKSVAIKYNPATNIPVQELVYHKDAKTVALSIDFDFTTGKKIKEMFHDEKGVLTSVNRYNPRTEELQEIISFVDGKEIRTLKEEPVHKRRHLDH